MILTNIEIFHFAKSSKNFLYFAAKLLKMRNPVLLFSLIFFSLFTQNSLSQYDYRRGYIVDMNNDTLHGWIEFGNPKTNYKYCFFKTDSSSEAKMYTPEDLKAYIFPNQKYYISKTIKKDDKEIKVFLEYLLHGIVNLYYYKDNNEGNFYYIEKEGVLTELTNTVKEIRTDKGLFTKESNRYIGVFKYITKEDPTLHTKIEKMNFDHKSFIEISKSYHQNVCDSFDCEIFYKKKLNDSKWVLKGGISAGLTYSKLDLKSSYEYYFENSVDDNSPIIKESSFPNLDLAGVKLKDYSAAPGIFLNISRNTSSSIQMELWYIITKYSIPKGSVNFEKFSIPVSFKQDFFFHKRINPYFNVGLVFNYYSKGMIKDAFVSYDFPKLINDNIFYIPYNIDFSNTNLIADKTSLGFFHSLGVSYDINSKVSINLELRKLFETIATNDSKIDENITFEGSYNFVNSTYFVLSLSSNL